MKIWIGVIITLAHLLIVMIPLILIYRERWIFIIVFIAVILIYSAFIIYDI